MVSISSELWEELLNESLIFENERQELTPDYIIKKFKKYKIDKETAKFLINALRNRAVLHDDLFLRQREENVKTEISNLKKDLKRKQHEIDSKDLVLNRYFNVFDSNKNLKLGDTLVIKEDKKQKKSKNIIDNDSVAYIILSDLHFEERVLRDEVNGRNEYNPDIAKDRCETMVTNGLKLLKKERMTSNIDTLVFAIIGDIITGRIHDELIEGNSLGASSTDIEVKNLILDMIYRFVTEGKLKKMIIPFVRGNHGRTTAKRSFGKTSYENSRETMIYHSIADALSNYEEFKKLDCEFEVHQTKSDYTYIEVYGKRIRFAHGDHFNYNNGMGGIAGPALRWLNRINGADYADMTFIGHWHQIHLEIAPNIMVNGAVIGTTAYSLKFESGRRPPQQIFCIQDKWRGFTMRTHIDCLNDTELLDFFKSLKR